jgi:hypothetical protein
MMQKVTNLEILKLSHWNPAKSMLELIKEIREFLQGVARLEVESDRNNMYEFPAGAYYTVENLLLRLALSTEIEPRLSKDVGVEAVKAAPINRAQQDAEPEVVCAAGGGGSVAASGGGGAGGAWGEVGGAAAPTKATASQPHDYIAGDNTATTNAPPFSNTTAKTPNTYWASGTGYGMVLCPYPDHNPS